MTHTPGPWIAGKAMKPETVVKARLIAAAPEMLTALLEYRDTPPDIRAGAWSTDWYSRMTAAIAKATKE